MIVKRPWRSVSLWKRLQCRCLIFSEVKRRQRPVWWAQKSRWQTNQLIIREATRMTRVTIRWLLVAPWPSYARAPLSLVENLKLTSRSWMSLDSSRGTFHPCFPSSTTKQSTAVLLWRSSHSSPLKLGLLKEANHLPSEWLELLP